MFEKKKVYPVKINGTPFYVKVKRDASGNVSEIFEKPNLKQIQSGHHVGEHIVVGIPTASHYDHASGAINSWAKWKEFPVAEGKPLDSKYLVSGSNWGVIDSWSSQASFAIVIP